MSEITRRRLLGSAAAVGISAATMSVLPLSVQKALASTPTRAPRLRDIEHVVMLMQENRSFDHYFGTLSGVAGFDDPNAITLSNGNSVFQQPDYGNPAGYAMPFHLDTGSTNAQAIPSTDHSWGTQHASWNNGAMDSWMHAHRATEPDAAGYVMGYYTREDIPFQYALADAFTICDHYHCSVLGPTFPNRMHWMTGTVDAAGKYGGPLTSNTVGNTGLRWTTYPERLEAAGISWKVYEEGETFGLNMLRKFAAFRNAPSSSPLYRNGIAATPHGQFEYDAMHDRLPAVSWLIPTLEQCEHPNALPAAGADYVASKIAAVASNPDVWAKTVFILNYDENDGLFDHVVPPTPPKGTAGEFVRGLPVGAGFRVPCIVVSPWTAGGWVASQQFDHTSVLQFLELFTGVRERNISSWRRATFGNMSSVFRFGQPRTTPPPLPSTAQQVTTAQQNVATLPPPDLTYAHQQMPHQEQGSRGRLPGTSQTSPAAASAVHAERVAPAKRKKRPEPHRRHHR